MDSISDCIDLKSFQQIKCIGEGTFGIVFLVKKISTDQKYAAKVIKKSVEQNTTEELIYLFREIMINSKLDHPNILKFIGISPFDFEKKPKFTIITEFAANGSLENVLELERHGLSPSNWNDTKKLIIIYGIASGISYLHEHDIIHRDLKPDNILLNEYLLPKISDFGLSKVTNEDVKGINYKSKIEIKGTPAFLAPETWATLEFTKASDVYAYGLIIYEIITGEIPWSEYNYWANINTQVCQGNRPNFKFEIPESYRKLIEICWSQDPKERPTFDEIVEILKTDAGFITDVTDENDFFKYVEYIDYYKSEIDGNPLNFESYFDLCNETFKAVEICGSYKNSNGSYTKIRSGYLSKSDYENLNNENKTLVDEAENDIDKQFELAQKLIKGTDGFQVNVQAGIKYLKISYRAGNIDAAIFYSNLLIQGEIILPDTEKAVVVLKKFLSTKNPTVYTLYAIAQKKEENFEEALKYFKKASGNGNAEAMYEYAKLVYKGRGTKQNFKKSLQLFQMAKKNKYNKSDKYLRKLLNNDELNYEFDELSKIIVVPFDSKQNNVFRGIVWYLGKGNPISVYDNEIIDILVSSQNTPDKTWFLPQNVVDFKNTKNTSSNDCCFNSLDSPDSWLCYDFKDVRVKPTHYSLRTNSWNAKGWYHPLSWKIEASVDFVSWITLDVQNNLIEMDNAGVIKTFQTLYDDNKSFRYLRIIQTDKNSHDNYCLTFSALEFYGTFIRP